MFLQSRYFCSISISSLEKAVANEMGIIAYKFCNNAHKNHEVYSLNLSGRTDILTAQTLYS